VIVLRSTIETNGANGVSEYELSLTSGSAMSEPMPGNVSVPSANMPFTISTISGAWGWHAGLMHTMPDTSGCSRAVQSVSEPPIDSPTTTTLSTRADNFSYVVATTDDQSLHRVGIMSLTAVP